MTPQNTAGNTGMGSGQKSGNNNNDISGKAKQKTEEVLDKTSEKAGQLGGQFKQQANSQLSSQKEQLAEGMGTMAQMVHTMGEQMSQKNQGMLADYTHKAASTLDDTSRYLKEHNMNEIVRGVENFARREPVLFVGGAFALGMLAVRFFKSSNPSQQSNNWQQPDQGLMMNPENDNNPLTPPPYLSEQELYYGESMGESTGYSQGIDSIVSMPNSTDIDGTSVDTNRP